jgi:hypothetical protein
MTYARLLAVCVVGIVVSSTPCVEAEDLSRYRNFALGSDVASVSTAAGVAESEVKTIHHRPALLQDLEYRPPHWVAGSTEESTDPVEQITFSFYNDQLFRIVIDYGHDRTEGMTGADMIQAISAVYGPRLTPTSPARRRPASHLERESGSPVARWGDSQHAIVLYEVSTYGTTAFRLVVMDPGRDDLARSAATRAARLDDQEAPQRELARQQKERDDARVATAKARGANKGVFRP